MKHRSPSMINVCHGGRMLTEEYRLECVDVAATNGSEGVDKIFRLHGILGEGASRERKRARRGSRHWLGSARVVVSCNECKSEILFFLKDLILSTS